MTEWIKHDGGPQPVADDVWVEVFRRKLPPRAGFFDDGPASLQDWASVIRYRVLNQHLIDAARLEGIRLGLEAAARVADAEWHDPNAGRIARLITVAIRALDPETIAKEADQ